MTWIVGMEGGLGYGIGVSDIRVILRDGSERDCLQKIYTVGNFIATGYAGSVKIGFAMVDKLTELLHCENPSGAWDPITIAEWWPQDARDVFNSFPKPERDLQSHVMLIGAHPSQNNGSSPWPRNYVYIFRSPEFKPLMVPPPEVGAIGCGAQFEPCRAVVESLSKDHEFRFSLMQAEQGCPGGMASLLSFQLTTLLRDANPSGVSSHLHCCWVYRGRVVIAPLDYATAGRWKTFSIGVDAAEKATREAQEGGGRTLISPGMDYFQMPPVAKSFRDLESLLSMQGLSAVGAACPL